MSRTTDNQSKSLRKGGLRWTLAERIVACVLVFAFALSQVPAALWSFVWEADTWAASQISQAWAAEGEETEATETTSEDTSGGEATATEEATSEDATASQESAESDASTLSAEPSSDLSLTPAEDSVAKIGEKGYESLDSAFTEVQNNETITLLADITYAKDAQIELTGTKTFTLDLNGKTIVDVNSKLCTKFIENCAAYFA